MIKTGRLAMILAAAGFCLAASVRAEEAAPPGGGDGERGARPREGGVRHGWSEGRPGMRPRRGPEQPPLFTEVAGMKEELEKHLANIKALQEQLRPAPEKPGEGQGAVKPEDEAARKEALQARVDQVAPGIVDEYIRHFQAVAELLKADRDAAVTNLKEHMMTPRGRGPEGPGGPGGQGGPGGPGDGPGGKGFDGKRDKNRGNEGGGEPR